MNIEQLYRDYNIPYVTEGHKHTSQGWVHTACPFCTGNPGYHLGYDTIGEKFVCWRCGGKTVPYALMKLLKKDFYEVSEILKHYNVYLPKQRKKKLKTGIKPFLLPSNMEALSPAHKKYLLNRNFDPDKLIEIWGISGTGIHSKLDDSDYSRRIIIPYNWDHEIVSFDSRDITEKHKFKYKACPKEREGLPRKSILYGKQDEWTDVGICVEGATDVWRLGVHSFATSGIIYKPAQVREMAKAFKTVYVMFDGESQAIIQANKLVAELKFRGVESKRIDIVGDPGGMSQKEADNWIQKLIL